ncbi:hypothetical protein DPMN_084324 [Dreissena polymorpha]|uniref:Uncharacterized protein n=1 Tax=Dreissena polymorpha TaxID=45954 RepID=A0A9D3YEN4_DREPO|nr:hypothetical protein DPMN_084324 [Dreissena polymorpha]
MKLKENEISKTIEMKARLKELKERDRLREEKDMQYTERVRALKQQKLDLEQSLLEKQSVLSSLDDELMKPSYYKHTSNTHREKTTEKQVHMPFMLKPNVQKFSEPAQFQFQEWKIEEESMFISNIYHKEILRQAIRNAIGGKPRKILTTLKPTATTEEILKTLESNF